MSPMCWALRETFFEFFNTGLHSYWFGLSVGSNQDWDWDPF